MTTLPAVAIPSPRRVARLLAAGGELWSRVVAAVESRRFAYFLLLALQLKVVWGAWAVRDITDGDTSSYFGHAWKFYADKQIHAAWSPLYCAFYGSLLHVNSDPVWVTLAHRMLIVLASGALTLAVLRCLLPPAVAWLGAAWWAVLPIVFETLYEVHLFTVIPVAVVWLLLGTATGPARRAAALALLGASVALVRNELSVPFGLLAALLLVWEWRSARDAEEGRRARLLRAAGWYATALALAAGACLAGYERSFEKFPELSQGFKHKHTLNMAQVYSFGYQQRHPEWTNSPWTEYQPLMESTFGKALPSLREMIAANPRAVWEHFAWNFRLTPGGLQLLMFSSSSSELNPDYRPSPVVGSKPVLGRTTPLYLSIAMGTVWVAGLALLWRNRREWWVEFGSARSLAWLGMFIVVAVMPMIIATQRPRPSYLFVLSITLIALTGTFLWAILRSCGLGERLRQVMPLVMLGLIVLVPNYYKARAKSKENPPAPARTAEAIQRLKPHRTEILRSQAGVLSSRDELPRYFTPGVTPELYSIYAALPDWRKDETFAQRLARGKVKYFYLDEEGAGVLAYHARSKGRPDEDVSFTWTSPPPGWVIISRGDLPGDRWRLFRQE